MTEPPRAALPVALRRSGRWLGHGHHHGRRRTATLLTGTTLVSLIAVVGLVGPLLSPYDPLRTDLPNALLPAGRSHWLGTDQFGRDLLTRIVHAISLDLRIALIGTGGAFTLGIVLGALAGYWGGLLDVLLGRLIDVLIAFPPLVLLLALVTVLGQGTHTILIAITCLGWIAYARMLRAQIMSARTEQYIVAAQALGLGDLRILRRHLLPNTITVAVVYAMSDIVLNMQLLAVLSFLGLGVPPPTPEWGSMIAEGRIFLLDAWGLSTWPGLALVFVGVSFSLLGDGIADLLRPIR